MKFREEEMCMDSEAALNDVNGLGNKGVWILKPSWGQKNGHWANSRNVVRTQSLHIHIVFSESHVLQILITIKGKAHFVGKWTGLNWRDTKERSSSVELSLQTTAVFFFFLLIEKLNSFCLNPVISAVVPKKPQVKPWGLLKLRFLKPACFPKPMREIERVWGRQGCEWMGTEIQFPCLILLHNGYFWNTRDYVRHKSNDSKSNHFICQSY